MNPCFDILAHCEKIYVSGDSIKEELTEELLPKEKGMLAKELDEEKVKKKEREDKKIFEEKKKPKSEGAHWDKILKDVPPEEQPEQARGAKSEVDEKVEKLKQKNSVSKFSEDAEPKSTPEDDLKLEDIIKPLSRESAKRVDEFFLFLKDIHLLILKPKRQEMKELQEVIALVTTEIEELKKKNRELEREIELMREKKK